MATCPAKRALRIRRRRPIGASTSGETAPATAGSGLVAIKPSGAVFTAAAFDAVTLDACTVRYGPIASLSRTEGPRGAT